FDGAKTQILSVDGFTNFDDLTVYTGTVLVETNPNGTVILNGKLTNHGTIRTTQPVGRLELYYFGLAGAYPNSAGMRIEVTERSGGDPLTAIQVDRVDANHPHAPAGAVTDVYWTITPAGTNYVATVVLPQHGLGNPTACRYAGSSWDCD